MSASIPLPSYQVSPQLCGTSSDGVCLDSLACPLWKHGTPGPPWHSRWPSPPSGSAPLSHVWEPKQEPAGDIKRYKVMSNLRCQQQTENGQVLDRSWSFRPPQLMRLQCTKIEQVYKKKLIFIICTFDSKKLKIIRLRRPKPKWLLMTICWWQNGAKCIFSKDS